MEIKELSQSFIDLLHEQAIEINNIYDDIGGVFDAYGNDTPIDSELTSFYDECDRIYAVCDIIIQNSMRAIEREQKKHGGTRKGAGRKVKRLTKQIRIDKDLAESFKMMSDYYRSLDDDGRRDFDNRFSTSGLLFPNG
ncbi:hypothetical protein [Vibrio cortegadensis]|uniref:Uncharacterized protein n=1 Tax=Vibrio cortegadensis TaxID=1328770 RepID=A0ABV4M819_9VIBR